MTETSADGFQVELIVTLRSDCFRSVAELRTKEAKGTVFCAGADLSGDAFAADYPDRLIELHKAMDTTPIPVIQ